jgi:energy-coupling factor transport system substrate-specific component
MKKAVSHRCVDPGQRIREKHKMRCISALFLAVGMALLLFVCAGVWQGKNYLLAGILMLLFLFGVVVLNFEKRKPRAREIVLLSTMTGLSVAANELCSHTIPLHGGTAMVVISGIALGPETGFFVGALSRFVCNFFSGQGPWTPWQMVSWGLMGYLAGLCFNTIRVRGRLEEETLAVRFSLKKNTSFRLLAGPLAAIAGGEILGYLLYVWTGVQGETFWGWRVYVFGFLGLAFGMVLQRKKLPVDPVTTSVFVFLITVLVYGGIMNFAAMLMTSQSGGEVSVEALKALYVTGLPYDLMHGAGAALCMFFAGDVILQKLQRIQIKFGIGF